MTISRVDSQSNANVSYYKICNYLQSADLSESRLTMTTFKLTQKRSFGYYEIFLKDRFKLKRTENE